MLAWSEALRLRLVARIALRWGGREMALTALLYRAGLALVTLGLLHRLSPF